MNNTIYQIKQRLLKKAVDLNRQHIDDDLISEICRNPTQHIQTLNLTGNELTPLAIISLSTAVWTNITSLNLQQNNIGIAGCKYLTRVNMPSLKDLNLCLNSIEGIGIQHLSKSQWPHLRCIRIMGCKIIQGMKWMSKAAWRKISEVEMSCNQLTFDQCLYLLFLQTKSLQKTVIVRMERREKRIIKAAIEHKWKKVKLLF